MASHSCAYLQVCPYRPPGQAPQTSKWMELEIALCLHTANRGAAMVGLPHAPAPLNQHEMRAKAAPELRARQEQGDLPPLCRGAACTADEFIESITSRFQIHLRGIAGQAKLKGKHVLVLLPEHDTQAIASANWLLSQHAEFSGRGGRVIMNDLARAWLPHSRGAMQLDSANAPLYQASLKGLKDLEAEIAELVKREQLGAPPSFAGANFHQLRQQFLAWLGKTRSAEALAELSKYEEKFRHLLQFVSERAVVHIQRLGIADGLTVSVLAGADAEWMTLQRFPGLVVSPAAQWNVQALTASLRGRGLVIDLLGLNRQPIPHQQILNRKLLVAGVEGDEPDQALALASRLVAGLVENPAGKVPVTVLALGDSLAVHHSGHKTETLDDPLLEKSTSENLAFNALVEALLKLISEHTLKEPLSRKDLDAMDFVRLPPQRGRMWPALQVKTSAMRATSCSSNTKTCIPVCATMCRYGGRQFLQPSAST